MPTIAIIGGTGKMGQWFKRFFESEGCKVLIVGRKTKLTPEEAAKKANIVIISVPIHDTVDMIKKVGPHMKKDSLLMDLTSIKITPLEAMMKHAECEVLGGHPIFGPSIESLKNQTIVLCPGRGGKWERWMVKTFVQAGAKVKIATAKEHDRMMSVIQGVVHFSSITISHTLKKMGIDVMESQEYSSPVYKLRMDMVGRILHEDPSLYADIEIMNPEARVALKKYLETSNDLYKVICNDDRDGFINYFKEAADYLGDFKDEAEEYSNYIINQLVKRKRKKGEVLK